MYSYNHIWQENLTKTPVGLYGYRHGISISQVKQVKAMTIQDGNIPLFFQFYLTLKNEIHLGDRQPGERIPTIVELHKEYGVSQITVRNVSRFAEK